MLYARPEIRLLVRCATLSGAADFVGIRVWAAKKQSLLRRIHKFKRGVPSHDTVNDVMNLLRMTQAKASRKVRRKTAGWDQDYLKPITIQTRI